MDMRTALITGANRGIGRHAAQQLGLQGLRIVIAARSLPAAESAADELAASGVKATLAVALDVADIASIRTAAAQLLRQGVRVDVLINNAGIYPEGSMLAAADADFERALDVNTLGAVRCARIWMPGMIERGYGRIVNLTSGYGCFSEGLGGPAAYSISKAALNAVTVQLAQACRGDVKVAAVDPGWVRTRMGGPQAPRAVEEAAADVAWAAMLDSAAPNGVLWRRRKLADW